MWLVFHTVDGHVIRQLEHEIPLDVALRNRTRVIGDTSYYYLECPVWMVRNVPGAFPDQAGVGTPAMACMLRHDHVDRIWTQMKPRPVMTNQE